MSLLDWFLLQAAARALRHRRADFYHDLASALEDKVPLFTTLRKYETRARVRDRGQSLLFQRMLRDAMNGSLSTALAKVVPPSELIMIDAIQGGSDAALAQGLYFLSDTVDKVDKMFRTMRKAIAYPTVLLLVFASLLTGFSLFAVPVLAELLPPAQWPAIGQALYAVSYVISHYGPFLALGVVALLTAFFLSLPRWQGPTRRWLDKRAPYSLYRDFSGAMLIVSLSSLMRTGVSLRTSLERATRFSSPWMRWHLRQILMRLSSEQATHFGRAFGTGVLSRSMEDRVQDAGDRRDPVAA
ncbi:MAG: type II secretion system F family protein, partial [Burkholderiaceae bacterium]